MAARTSTEELAQEGLDALAEALRAAGSSVVRSAKLHPTRDVDIAVRLSDGRTLFGEVKAAAHADPARIAKALPVWAARLEHVRAAARAQPQETQAFAMVVADVVPEATQTLLREAGWGWLDRRGHLFVQAPGVLINDTAAAPRPRTGARRPTDPIRGRAGLTVAAALLMRPDEPVGVREIARAGDLAPSTVSAAVKSLRESALLDGGGRPLIPELFWALADAWNPEHAALSSAPTPKAAARLGLNLTRLERPGWAVTGTLAASAWGAPVPVQSGYPPDFYVPSSREARAAARQLHVAQWDERACTVAVAPVVLVISPRYDAQSHATPWLEWPLTHPLFAALDLAQDRSRGVEILEDWTPPPEFRRVW